MERHKCLWSFLALDMVDDVLIGLKWFEETKDSEFLMDRFRDHWIHLSGCHHMDSDDDTDSFEVRDPLMGWFLPEVVDGEKIEHGWHEGLFLKMTAVDTLDMEPKKQRRKGANMT